MNWETALEGLAHRPTHLRAPPPPRSSLESARQHEKAFQRQSSPCLRGEQGLSGFCPNMSSWWGLCLHSASAEAHGRRPPPGPRGDHALEHTLRLSAREASMLADLAPGGQDPGLLRGARARGHHHGVLPCPQCGLSVPPRKEHIHSSGALPFAAVLPETPPHCLVWRPAGFTILVPQDRVYLHI